MKIVAVDMGNMMLFEHPTYCHGFFDKRSKLHLYEFFYITRTDHGMFLCMN